ncbi:hypothetical protein JAAARDRAFT_33493 [Jaapia argillacea MUCL 33604]|uniref:Uncharacterized protein n=1 Tax=Jaapia argillacea MUCL 33604 TaxID=933084 RepID=A0A067QBF2_9AGAM|nr:hypothetical protein JAAARDRAFT_33493 [Jaapia argillacea MUCL 33604]
MYVIVSDPFIELCHRAGAGRKWFDCRTWLEEEKEFGEETAIPLDNTLLVIGLTRDNLADELMITWFESTSSCTVFPVHE